MDYYYSDIMRCAMKMDIDGLDKLQEGIQKAVQKGVNELNRGLDRINNPQENNSAPSICPNCNAKLNILSDSNIVTCEYCGSQFDNIKNKSVVDSVFDFVEKQQKFATEQMAANRAANAENVAAKAQKAAEKEAIKEELRRRRRIRHRIKRIIFLIALIGFGYYYTNNKEACDAVILPFISNILDKL